MESGIYQILNTLNNKRYIGSTVCFENRFADHQRSLEKNEHGNRYLQNAWNKYGKEAFEFNVLLYCDVENLLFYEQRAIDTWGNYNICKYASSTLGTKRTPEVRKKMSEGQKGKTIPYEQRQKISAALKGLTPWNRGIPRTQEERRKMSRALKGKDAWNKGKTMSEEYRQKLSEAHKGFVMSEEQKNKISISVKKAVGQEHWNIGYKHSSETKKQIGDKLRGVPKTEETRRNMAEARKQWWARKRLAEAGLA
jgi:group I intron endonuclease